MRKVQDNPAHRPHDVDADRQQRVAHPRDLRAGERGAVGAQLELLHQHIGGGGQGHAQLIGPEAGTAGPAEGERMMQLFQSILAVAARAVDVRVDPLGRLTQIRVTKRGLSRASRPWCHTTSALMTTRRGAAHVPA